MVASRQQVYFIAIRMQSGNVRRELGLLGLGERASRVALEAMDGVDAQVRRWAVDGMVAEPQLRELLQALLQVPERLRTLKEAGREEEITLARFEEWGLLPSPAREAGPGPVS